MKISPEVIAIRHSWRFPGQPRMEGLDPISNSELRAGNSLCPRGRGRPQRECNRAWRSHRQPGAAHGPIGRLD